MNKFGLTVSIALAGTLVLGWAALGGADVYPLGTCPVSGQALGSMGDPIVKVYDGREVRFCCGGCPAKYEANPAAYTEKIDAKLVEQQKALYPLDTCVVSGEKLGAMGDPVEYVYQNRLIRLCCKSCVEKFGKDAGQHVQRLDAAVIEKQLASYPLTTCVVSGEKLGGDMGKPVELVTGNRLVRLCCTGCRKDFEKNPAQYLSKLDGSAAPASSAEQHALPHAGHGAANSGHAGHQH